MLVVGIRFKRAGKVYYFDPAGIGISANDYVVVQTSRGAEVGRVVIPTTDVDDDEVVQPLKPVERVADWRDLTMMESFRMQEAEALAVSKQKVREHDLPMKMVRAEYSFDGTRLTIYFSADKRVDFRDLVRDLARVLHTRIELRQVGVRDEAKLLGGIDKCGLELCCSSWMTDFPRVSIKTAKTQDLPLNPPEISGVCGRLLCCLTFEQDTYVEVKGQFPKVGARIQWATGQAKVIHIDVMQSTMTLLNEADEERYVVTAEEWRELQERQAQFRPAPFGKPIVPEGTEDAEDAADDATPFT
ncbi:MAG: stage 0 sporulation family protein [Anaerolineae bacterium]